MSLRVFSRRFFILLLNSIVVYFLLTAEGRTWQLHTDSQNISVESGVESNIDFFLSDYRYLDSDIRIIVQRLGSNMFYETKCILNHSVTSGCKSEGGPCECVGERSGSYRYRLKMNFTEQDGGLCTLLLTIFKHNHTTVNIQVVQRKTTSQERESTDPLTVAVATNSINDDSLSTTGIIAVSSIAIVIIIIIVISSVILVWCRSRILPPTNLQVLAARAERANELTEIHPEDPHQYDVPGDVEYTDCRSQNVGELVSRDEQSANTLTRLTFNPRVDVRYF